MELTREQLEKLANPTMLESTYEYKNCFVAELAKQLLAEMDKPKVWENAPEWAKESQVHFWDGCGHNEYSTVYTRELPKTRIDEIAEEAASHWEGGSEALEKAIKSAILQARKEWEVER